ncbi:hypothetical protein [Corynebacterium comes]|uniref:Uncharacterized protein n=1 Tax=Corynebacterium comes TaxID=2675218 RepID=A0A6B8VIE5_9CORY|nr:hypothetical protein [Corynebacterium comes]QGU05102.1 hypothetical protein CETAM_09245 [Corynebacterium comes]
MSNNKFTQRESDGAFVRLMDGANNPILRAHRNTKQARRDYELEWLDGHRVVLTKQEATDLWTRLGRALGKEED